MTQVELTPASIQRAGGSASGRLENYYDAQSKPEHYLSVFRKAISGASFRDGVDGVYPDGWTSDRLVVSFGGGLGTRSLVGSFEAPGWIPADQLVLDLKDHEEKSSQRYSLKRGESLALEKTLTRPSGWLELVISPVFQPSACNMGADTRTLGCRIKKLGFVYVNGEEPTVDLIEEL